MRARDERQLDRLRRAGLYRMALAFIRGDFDVEGDLIEAIRFTMANAHRGLSDLAAAAAAHAAPRRIESWFQRRNRAAWNVRFHYDRSNDFYRTFLDTCMVYSCAYFKDPAMSLDDAQTAKLDHILRKLDLRRGERFLDVGCGWGALVIRAAEQFGALATGCTLSIQQDLLASEKIRRKHLEKQATVRECDYRELSGRFDKIASVGMFEHVGRHRLRGYFRTIFNLLEEDGLFLNHGIVRPEGTRDAPETLFLQRRVFPGGELANLSVVIHEAGMAGFEVLDVENLRPHYATTCRRWVERLRENAQECLKFVDGETYRTWLLYLAASALSFETGATDLCQILMAKRGRAARRHATRDYIYAT